MLLKTIKQSLLQLRRSKEESDPEDEKGRIAKEDDLQKLNDDITAIGETITFLIEKAKPAAVLAPNERPLNKKAQRNAFSNPVPQWNSDLPFVAIDESLGDLSKPVVQQPSRHRAPKVAVMKTWSTIRDKPTFVRIRDQQPVLAEGALSRRFDIISNQSTLDLMRRANSSKRHPVDMSAYDSLMDLQGEPPTNAYFHFGDFARVADDKPDAVQSAPLEQEDILTPAVVMSAMPPITDEGDQAERRDELPEDVLPGPERVVGNLPSPSAAWMTSENVNSDQPQSAGAPPPVQRTSTATWEECAKKFITREMSLYFHGKGGKEKLVTNTGMFESISKKILARVLQFKSNYGVRNVMVEFTEDDEKKIMKEVDKIVHDTVKKNVDRKRVRAPEML